MARVRIKMIKSVIDQTKRQKATMQALGLRKINQTREHELTPQIEGMINKISHLVTIENI